MGRKENSAAFVVYSAENRICSFGYRIWASQTSFYIKIRDSNNPIKVSLHGPDPRHGNKAAYKFGIDGSMLERAHETSAWRFDPDSKLGWFDGVDLDNGVTHLVRIRIPWSTLQYGAPSGPQPSISKDIGRHFQIDAPDILMSVDVDLYLSSNGRPYWRDAEQVRLKNAGLGPLRNTANQLLTGVSSHASVWKDPYTKELGELARRHSGPNQRILCTHLDESGFLWLRELTAPATILRAYKAEELQKVAKIEHLP